MTRFENKKRVCGSTTEGFGPDAFRWFDYEILCPECGEWCKEYGEVSRQIGEDPDVHELLCVACGNKPDEYLPEVIAHVG